MATKGRPRKAKDKATDSLREAVRFVALAQRDEGTLTQTHCVMKAGWIVASDGVLTAAHRIEDTLEACPQTKRLLAALERSGEGYSITQLEGNRLAVKSGPLRATVPCVNEDQISVTWCDPNVAPLDDRFLKACQALTHMVADSGAAVSDVSFLLQGKTLSATNKQVVAEYWHGLDLPPYAVLPKPVITALLRAGKEPIGFGFNGNSATFHYADQSFIKTQLYEDKWPNVIGVFDKMPTAAQTPLPDKLFEALAAIGDFSDCGEVRCDDGVLHTVNKDGDGAEHDVKDLIAGPRFSIKNLELIKPIAKTWAVDMGAFAILFYGENLRGAISFYRT